LVNIGLAECVFRVVLSRHRGAVLDKIQININKVCNNSGLANELLVGV
jgi:hypothetical protein